MARWLLRGVVVATALAQMARGDVAYGLFCLGALAATVVLSRAALAEQGGFALAIELAIGALLVLDMTLGNALGLYRHLPWWDKALHFGAAVVFGLLGFWFIYILHAASRLRPHPVLDGIAILLVTLGLGAAWEIAEYAVDQLTGSATQGAPGMAEHDDSMIDLVLDGVGAIVAAIAGPLAMRHSSESRRRVAQLGRRLARAERA